MRLLAQQDDDDVISPTAKANKKHRSRKLSSAFFINNRRLQYVPTELLCVLRNENENLKTMTKVIVYCRTQQTAKILPVLRQDIENALSVLPKSVVNFLVRRISLWINDSYMTGPDHDPSHYKHCTTHHTKEWLLRYECS